MNDNYVQCADCGSHQPEDHMFCFLRVAQVFVCEDCIIRHANNLDDNRKQMLLKGEPYASTVDIDDFSDIPPHLRRDCER